MTRIFRRAPMTGSSNRRAHKCENRCPRSGRFELVIAGGVWGRFCGVCAQQMSDAWNSASGRQGA